MGVFAVCVLTAHVLTMCRGSKLVSGVRSSVCVCVCDRKRQCACVCVSVRSLVSQSFQCNCRGRVPDVRKGCLHHNLRGGAQINTRLGRVSRNHEVVPKTHTHTHTNDITSHAQTAKSAELRSNSDPYTRACEML